MTVMMVTTSCWWSYDGNRFKLVTESLCWRLFVMLVIFSMYLIGYQHLKLVTNTFCLQHPSNIDVNNIRCLQHPSNIDVFSDWNEILKIPVSFENVITQTRSNKCVHKNILSFPLSLRPVCNMHLVYFFWYVIHRTSNTE